MEVIRGDDVVRSGAALASCAMVSPAVSPLPKQRENSADNMPLPDAIGSACCSTLPPKVEA